MRFSGGGIIFYPMANRIRKVELTHSERGVLEERSRSRTLPQREVERARIVLMSAAGKTNAEIQSALGVSRTKVQRWLDRYEESGSAGVRSDRPRAGGPKTITPEQEAEIVRRTLENPPQGQRNTLEHADAGAGGGCEPGQCGTHLESTWAAAASDQDVQALERSELC